MIKVSPIKKALVPVNSEAAEGIAGPNYDEFQGDLEIFEHIADKPLSILRVTMAHVDAPSPEDFLKEGSEESLARAGENMRALAGSDQTRVEENVMVVYEMVDPTRGDRQIGLGCMIDTDQIRTEANPEGSIVRNEGIYEKKAAGRARLVEATSAYIGTVNLATPDADGLIAQALEDIADARECDFKRTDHKNNVHKIWLIKDDAQIDRLTTLFAVEPHVFVADGNHRSAAAAQLGYESFLTVIFIADRMRIDPYHRLLDTLGESWDAFKTKLADDFEITPLGKEVRGYQPTEAHDIGLYVSGQWHRLVPKAHTFDPDNAVEVIDSDILQRKFYLKQLGITDPKDSRLTFVGGDKGASYLEAQVDAGRAEVAFAMASVTMQQFIDVCVQGRYMPPKSTWFEPKIQSGLVMALLGE